MTLLLYTELLRSQAGVRQESGGSSGHPNFIPPSPQFTVSRTPQDTAGHSTQPTAIAHSSHSPTPNSYTIVGRAGEPNRKWDRSRSTHEFLIFDFLFSSPNPSQQIAKSSGSGLDAKEISRNIRNSCIAINIAPTSEVEGTRLKLRANAKISICVKLFG